MCIVLWRVGTGHFVVHVDIMMRVCIVCVPQIPSRKQVWHWTAGIRFASSSSLLAPSPLAKQRSEMSFQLQKKALVGTHIQRPIPHPKAAFELILHAGKLC